MATSTHISMLEYMHTSYRPDREYVDGELVERNVGKYEHSLVQALLAAWFMTHRVEWNVTPLTEQRVQVAANRVRIPDVTLIQRGPAPDVIVDPPVLVVEILSPDDSYTDTQRRAQDYQMMGVPTVWIIDPDTRTGRICVGTQWDQRRRLEVAGTDIFLDLDELFADLDRERQAIP